MTQEANKKNINPSQAYAEIYSLLEGQNIDQAFELSKRYIAIFPQSMQLRLLQAELKFLRFDYDQALEAFLQLYSGSKLSFVALRIAESYDHLKNYQQAAHYYQEALKLGSKHKNYIHLKLSRVYLYLHDDVASLKYEKKANKSAQVSESIILYPYKTYQSITRKRKPKNQFMTARLVIFAVVFLSTFLVPIVLRASKTEYIGTETTVTESAVAVEISEDSPIITQETAKKVMTIYNRTDRFFENNALLDYGVDYVYSTFGNTNSNILNNAIACEYEDNDYFFIDNTLYFNYGEDDEKEVFAESNLSHLNIMDGHIFYIYNAKYHSDAEIRGFTLKNQITTTYSAPFADNLIVDDKNFYYISKINKGYTLNYKRYYSDSEISSFPIDSISYLNQTQYDVYFISNQKLYKISKLRLNSDLNDLTAADVQPIKAHLNLDFLIVEGNYIYYAKVGEYGLFRDALTEDAEVKINDEFDSDNMFLNIYKNKLFMGNKFDSESNTEIYEKSGRYELTRENFPCNNVTDEFVYFNATIFY